jgi:hypothetical protein
MNYAFSTGKQSLTDVPIVTAYRPGAFMQSLELSLRMRNLEMILNRPPITGGICINGCGDNESSLISVDQSYGYPINERPYKAYKAALRTLGGGEEKNSDGFAGTFRLTELAPNPYQGAPTSLSNFLIPQSAIYDSVGGTAVTQKHYGDLIPMIFNYATFFTTFATNSGSADEINVAAGTPMEAACASSKTALPVPGYIMGFYKNPQVLTYYAVKGEAEFFGRMNPFGKAINLKAYAAAKPYGGRIGPILVKANSTSDFRSATFNEPRTSGGQPGRTSSFVFSFNTGADPRALPTGDKAGLPIPSSQSFYVQNESDPIGGVPSSVSSNMRFSVPNMIYNLPNGPLTNDRIPQTSFYVSNNLGTNESAGLYTTDQYRALRDNIFPASSDNNPTLDQKEIETAIERVRAPTNYDTLNYLVPTLRTSGNDLQDQIEGYESLKQLAQTNPITEKPLVAYFAPLFGQKTLYKNAATITEVLGDYVNSLESSVLAYNESLKEFADQMRNQPTDDPAAYTAAAAGIHADRPTPFTAPFTGSVACDELSIAAKFNHFFTSEDLIGNADNCDILPLRASIRDYIVGVAGKPRQDMYFITSYSVDRTIENGLDNAKLSTAFMPGPAQGTTDDGIVDNPLTPSGTTIHTKRNYYSTKFIGVSSVADTSSGYRGKSIYVETDGTATPNNPVNPTDFGSSAFANQLDTSELNEFGDLNF